MVSLEIISLMADAKTLFFKIKTVLDYVLDVVLDYQIPVTKLKRV